jgi:hypothetical protein
MRKYRFGFWPVAGRPGLRFDSLSCIAIVYGTQKFCQTHNIWVDTNCRVVYNKRVNEKPRKERQIPTGATNNQAFAGSL